MLMNWYLISDLFWINIIMHSKKIIIVALMILFVSSSCDRASNDDWQNPKIFERNKLPARAHFFAYESEKLAKQNNPMLSQTLMINLLIFLMNILMIRNGQI